MTNEERDLITRFFARVGGAASGGNFLPGQGGSVPASQPLPPVDRDADALIAQQFQQYPEARYRLTQMAIVQEAALAESSNQIRRLQWELEQTRNAMQQGGAHAQAQAPQQGRGFFGSLFGGGQQPQQPPRGGGFAGAPGYGGGYQQAGAPPPPQYPPNYQPGMFQNAGGSSFLGSALRTAAGVAGGMVVGNALMSAFSGHHEGGGMFGGGGDSGPWGANNAGGSPFDTAGTVPLADPASGFADAGYSGADPFGGGGNDGGGFQNTSFDQGGGDPFGGGGGFDQGGGGFDSGGFDSGGTDSA